MSGARPLPEAWDSLLRQFKEKLAERLWTLPTVSESEKELLYRQYLSDLDGFEQALAQHSEESAGRQKLAVDENNLLRSLLGLEANELKMQVVTLGQELASAQRLVAEITEEAEALRKRNSDAAVENEVLRKKVQELEAQKDRFRAEQIRVRQDDIRYFSETHEALRNQLKDLEFRLAGMRELFDESNKKLLTDKQEEVSLLQKKLLEEMETALRRKQELAWGEEEMFAKGVAHRVRTELVSAQGQLLLTLERLGLLDPESSSESFWRSRLRLLVEGGKDLLRNFRAVQAQLQNVTSTLDDYLHLTGRRELAMENVPVKELVQAQIAELYGDRRPTLTLEFLPDDPLPAMTGDRTLLRFIVSTLLQNAVEALPNESGRVTIALKNESSKGRIVMTVRDSGRGVPDHLQPRLFQPFFTTKDRRQGLSLSRARRYAELHGGHLDMIQTGPDGTTFQVELPLMPPAAAGRLSESRPAAESAAPRLRQANG